MSEIDSGKEQISKVTQSNTAAAEESVSASQEMSDQAQTLKEMIDEFNLKNEDDSITTEKFKELY